ncbi:MAG TPA: class I SAM-dependent methyltransferase [Fimbriimonadaceae bacterium]|nr:class I SAM-dependent methyltransferase [Fimbriimonadaceae bacterium]
MPPLSKFSQIGLRQPYGSPISYESLTEAIRDITLREGAKVVDFGCGNGESLLTVCGNLETSGLVALGVDLSPEMIAWANELKKHGFPAEFRCEDASLAVTREAPYDLMLCIGASHCRGSYHQALETASQNLNHGGYVLMGEGYWKRQPSKEYLDFLGATEDEMGSHFSNEEAGVAAGLVPILSLTSTDREWDEFEGRYSHNIERFCLENPSDPDVPAFRERIRKWRRMYREHGRDTLGFALYLFLKV